MHRNRWKKMAPQALAAALVLGCGAVPAAFAQDVTIGNTRLTLGAPQTQAMGSARSQFNVAPSPQDGQYFLYPKSSPLVRGDNDPAAGRPDAVGSLTFRQGKLIRVTHNLGSFRSADGQAAIQQMIRAFSEAPSQGDSPAVHTDTRMTGDASTTRVYFQYPDRVIQVLVFQPADQSELATVDITEQYALPGSGTPSRSVPGGS